MEILLHLSDHVRVGGNVPQAFAEGPLSLPQVCSLEGILKTLVLQGHTQTKTNKEPAYIRILIQCDDRSVDKSACI